MHPRVRLEYVAATRGFKPSVLERLRKLNPYSVPHFTNSAQVVSGRIRGYHPAARSPASCWATDAMSPRAFVSKFGRAAYDKVPRHFLLRSGHRKGIAREYIEDHF